MSCSEAQKYKNIIKSLEETNKLLEQIKKSLEPLDYERFVHIGKHIVKISTIESIEEYYGGTYVTCISGKGYITHYETPKEFMDRLKRVEGEYGYSEDM